MVLIYNTIFYYCGLHLIFGIHEVSSSYFVQTIQRDILFLNFLHKPTTYNPEKLIKGARNFYLQTDEKLSLGIWEVLPKHYVKDDVEMDESYFRKVLKNDSISVLIYCHGVATTRSSLRKAKTYEKLRENFYVISFDYRSYGDSTAADPSEDGLVNDTQHIISWVKARTSAKIFVWGHSLGSSVATHVVAQSKKNFKINGLVLESAFNSFKDVFADRKYTSLIKVGLGHAFSYILKKGGADFQTDVHIVEVDCPILILHAQDDRIVPYKLGYKLYETAAAHRKHEQGVITFIGFPKKRNYGHHDIYLEPTLTEIVHNFTQECSQWASKHYS